MATGKKAGVSEGNRLGLKLLQSVREMHAHDFARATRVDAATTEGRQRRKPPLYRRENTTAHRPNDHVGGDFRDERNAKRQARSDVVRRPMHAKQRRGRDYTPLFRFLLSKVGKPWAEVHAEAVARLDDPEPITWIVALHPRQQEGYVRVGESSYYSGLFVDEQGLLQIVAPSLGPSSLTPFCRCCTHAFNGKRFTQAYRAPIAIGTLKA